MTIDQYQLCPCGSNKKVKFCCARDVLPEINKVLTALQGEQRVAALDHVNHAIEKKGDKDCLLNIKTNILLQLGEDEKAREASKQVLKKNPDNPIALANHGLLDAAAGELDNAVDKLQQCLDLIGDNIPFSVIEAIKLVGISLLHSGRVIAGRNHLLLYQGFHPEKDEQVGRLISQTFMSSKIPLLMKVDNVAAEAPEGAPWREDFDTAVKMGSRGRWISAVESLQDLDEQYPDQPEIRRNIAIYQNCLGAAEDMAESWSDYAHTAGVDFEDAVEAEAFAQLIDPELEAEKLDVVVNTYPVNDVDKLVEELAADKRCDSVPLQEEALPEGPRPKEAFLIFDRERPDSGIDITRGEIPNVCCQIYVYGRQTDRDPRIELMMTKNDQYEVKLGQAKIVLGDHIGEESDSRALSQVTRLSDTLTWDWQFPPDTPRELQNELLNEQRREIMLEKWPKLSQPSLGGKTPADVVGQEKYKVALAAAVLLLELSTDQQITMQVDLDMLREKLQVPPRKIFDPSDIPNPDRISVIRLPQVDFTKLGDKDLVSAFQRAGMVSAWKALTAICHELLNRDSLDEEIDKSSVYLMLARMEPELEECMQLIQKARNVCITKKASPARTLIAELEARIERGDVEKAPDLIREIESKYIREPGVGNELMRVLVRFGIVDPNGSPRQEAAPAAPGNPPATESGYVWTPDGGSAAPEKPAEEKKLWVPGME
jgi:tetratricopeptide (TPR) repeat protein